MDPNFFVFELAGSVERDPASSYQRFDEKQHQTSIQGDRRVGDRNDVWAAGSPALAALELVMPESLHEPNLPNFPMILLESHAFASPLYRQVLFSIANNFAGIGAFSMMDVMQFVKRKTTNTMYRLIRSASGYSSRAIALNLFKGAIEVGDARIVGLFLNRNLAGIDVDLAIFFERGERCTAIERTASLQHVEVMTALLKYYASSGWKDVKFRDLNAALARSLTALPRQDLVQWTQRALPKALILQIMLEAGAELSDCSLRTLIHSGYKDLALPYIHANAHKNVNTWSKHGIFHLAFRHSSCLEAVRLIRLIIELGIDFNISDTGKGSGTQPNIIDIAASHSNLNAIDLMLEHGAEMTDDTLRLVISSGKEDLVRLMIERGANIHVLDPVHGTPFAAAIRLRDPQILHLLEQRGALAELKDGKHVVTALRAAFEAGNLRYVRSLIQLRHVCDPVDLGRVLSLAIKFG